MRELPDRTAASLPDIVDVVKRRSLDVSHRSSRTDAAAGQDVRLGSHVFAVRIQGVQGDSRAGAPTPEPDFSHAIRVPLASDLQVVRQELIGYEAAEISHIENVMPGELMRRVTRREETTELILTEEPETTQSESAICRRPSATSSPAESQKEASQQIDDDADQTTTTNYGRLVENSKTNYARSVTDRAVNKLTQMVRQQRVQREKKVFLDRAVHELNNSTGGNRIRGISVGRQEVQERIVNTGKRLLYDMVVPEPAAFLIEALKNAAQPENFQLIRPSEPCIIPSGLHDEQLHS